MGLAREADTLSGDLSGGDRIAVPSLFPPAGRFFLNPAEGRTIMEKNAAKDRCGGSGGTGMLHLRKRDGTDYPESQRWLIFAILMGVGGSFDVVAGNVRRAPAFFQRIGLRYVNAVSRRALGLEDQIGSLRPGKKADIILVDLLRPELTPVFLDPIRNIVPNLVYSADGSEVDTVIVNGRILAEGHRLLHIDLDSLIRQANRKAKEIAAQLAVSDRLTNLPLAQWTRQELY